MIRHMRHGSSPRLMALQPIRVPDPGESPADSISRSSYHSAQPHVPAHSHTAAACLAQQRAEQDFEWLLEEHGKALGQSEERFRTLIEALPAAIYMTDAAG